MKFFLIILLVGFYMQSAISSQEEPGKHIKLSEIPGAVKPKPSLKNQTSWTAKETLEFIQKCKSDKMAGSLDFSKSQIKIKAGEACTSFSYFVKFEPIAKPCSVCMLEYPTTNTRQIVSTLKITSASAGQVEYHIYVQKETDSKKRFDISCDKGASLDESCKNLAQFLKYSNIRYVAPADVIEKVEGQSSPEYAPSQRGVASENKLEEI